MREFIEKFIEIKGYAGSLGAALLYMQKPNEANMRLRKDFIDEGLKIAEESKIYPEITDGIIAEINRVCKEEKCGYELNLRKIPVTQFTIEICEMAMVSPYDIACNCEVILTDKKTPASCGRTTQALRKTLIRD